MDHKLVYIIIFRNLKKKKKKPMQIASCLNTQTFKQIWIQRGGM
jgi:hypothetical protein